MRLLRPSLPMRLISLAVGITSFLLTLPGPVFAAGETGLPVVVRPCDAGGTELSGPGYFTVTAAAGSTTQLYALVGNRSHENAIVSIAPVDAATGVYGGVTARLASQPRRRVGSWIHLPTRKVTLGPNKGEVVPFRLHVPRGTAPGQYVGAITAFVPARDTRRGRGFAFTVQTRLADDVVVTVPGRQHLRFRPAGVRLQRRTTSTYVVAHIKNAGTMLLKGWGHLWLWQPGRKKAILDAPLHLDTTLPHTTLLYPVRLGKHPRPGRYSYALKVWWNGGQRIQHGSVWVR